MDTLNLFEEALKTYTMPDLADEMHLHIGTLKRWKSIKKVPNSYKADFFRLLNIKEEIQGVREKDQFFTKPEVAKKCLGMLEKVARNLGIELDGYNFIEPSAGSGCFYNLLPEKRKIGIDIDPKVEGMIKADYLTWKPQDKKKTVVIGNPPFGLRGNLALRFINHSYDFADIVAFILPQLFESDGKGSAMKRVKGYELAHTKKLPVSSFCYPSGANVNINTIFQIWTKVKTENIKKVKIKTCDDFIKVYSLSNGGTPSSTRNKKMLNKCDIYLPSTTFQKMQCFNSFEDLPHKRGYGIVIHKDKTNVRKILKNNNWNKTAFASTNSALNLRTSLIQSVLVKNGFVDKKDSKRQSIKIKP